MIDDDRDENGAAKAEEAGARAEVSHRSRKGSGDIADAKIAASGPRGNLAFIFHMYSIAICRVMCSLSHSHALSRLRYGVI